MYDLAVNLLASVVAGAAVWLTQRLLRYRVLARRRAFFGIGANDTCLLVVPKHFSSPNANSVHRQDVAALVELAAIAKDCGARAELTHDPDVPASVGRVTEFCVGGPTANPRMAVHLRTILPGVRHDDYLKAGDQLTFRAGSAMWRREPGQVEYVMLAKVFGPTTAHPVFLVNGQTAQSNKAAARFLAARYPDLIRRYGASGQFCVVLRVVEPDEYGSDYAEQVADITIDAFQPYVEEPEIAASQ